MIGNHLRYRGHKGHSIKFGYRRKGGIIADNVNIDDMITIRARSGVTSIIKTTYQTACDNLTRIEEDGISEQESLDDQLDED